MVNTYLLCYDIRNPRRLVRVHRYFKRRAQALQYSVFLFMGDDRQLDHLLEGAAELIDPKQDDLRAYPVPQRGHRWRCGRSALPEGLVRGDLLDGW